VNPGEAIDSAEYIAARRVLLDALEALRPHESALILAGAQAVYLRTGPGSLPIAEFTTDGDLTINPALLSEAPPLDELMRAAGFELTELQGAQEPGIWQKAVEVGGREIFVPVDLIVPSEVAPPGGNRGARLQGHGKRAARKTSGLEAALIDNGVMPIEAVEPEDRRRARLRVAGVAALLVAKTHKIVDRVESGREDRLSDKDGADVLRLMGAGPPAAVATTIAGLIADPTAAAATTFAVERFEELFGRRGGAGIEMAARALREAMPGERVQATSLAYTRELYASLSELSRGQDVAGRSGGGG
jgi:hypothetical protein